MSLAKLPALSEFWLSPDGSGGHGRFGYRVSLSGHAALRFNQRVRPGLSFDDAFAYLQRLLRPPCVVSFRYQRPRTRRRGGGDGWLLLVDHDPPFTLACSGWYLSAQPGGYAALVFRAVTVLNGHDSW